MSKASGSASRSASGYWVVIPAYNEAATIRDIAARTLKQLPSVVVVVDGSTDGTSDALAGLPVTLLRNSARIGKAGSLWRGFQHALERGAVGVITVDADGQHAPEEIPRFVNESAFDPDALIIGVRHPDQRKAAFWRYVANRIADFWISWAAGASLDDSQSGFRLYPANLLKAVKIKHTPSRSFVFESEILIEAARSGFRIATVSIEALRRTGTRPSYFRPILDIMRITQMVAWKLLSRGLYPVGLYRSVKGWIEEYRHRNPVRHG